MKRSIKKLGIWMDHSHANTIEFNKDSMESNVISYKFTHDTNETVIHHKEQHQQSGYYKQIKDNIRNYDEVLLFGPTTAKNELANLLKADPLFGKIKIDLKDADKMTENQQHSFVKNFFTHQQTGDKHRQ